MLLKWLKELCEAAGVRNLEFGRGTFRELLQCVEETLDATISTMESLTNTRHIQILADAVNALKTTQIVNVGLRELREDWKPTHMSGMTCA